MATPDPIEVEQYKYLWTTNIEDYLLVCEEGEHEDTARIVNITREHPEMTVFTDDDFAIAVKQRMREAGVPLVSWEEMRQARRTRSGEH